MIYLSKVHHVYYKYTGNKPIAGKSYIVNEVGHFYLYMGDDMRLSPSVQIIVTNLGGGDLYYLPIERKKEIQIISSSY